MEWFFTNPFRLIIMPLGFISIIFPNKIRDFLYGIYLMNKQIGKFSVNDGFGPYGKRSQLLYIRITGLILLISSLYLS